MLNIAALILSQEILGVALVGFTCESIVIICAVVLGLRLIKKQLNQ